MRWAYSYCGVMALALAGCGADAAGKKLPESVSVTGTVIMNGAPLRNATLWFVPAEGTKGSGSTGYTDESGEYELTVVHGNEGAVPGKYKVLISKLVLPDGSEIPPDSTEPPAMLNAHELLPSTYSTIEETVLTAVVPADGGEIDFKFDADVIAK